MIEVNVVRVFTNKDGEFGSGAGIILDEGRHISEEQRQTISTKLGFDESVFVNNIQAGDVSIYNPQEEVAFAGVPLVVRHGYLANYRVNLFLRLLAKASR